MQVMQTSRGGMWREKRSIQEVQPQQQQQQVAGSNNQFPLQASSQTGGPYEKEADVSRREDEGIHSRLDKFADKWGV